MIYFDADKNAYGFKIENPIATIDDVTWQQYAMTDKWDIIDGVFTDITDTEEYKEKEKQKERQRLDKLTLTPSDVERALYKEKKMDFDDLKALIIKKLPMVDIKGLSIEFRAKDFYRGAEANGMRLFDVVGSLLEYTPEDMDYLFEHKELPEKDWE